MRQMHRVIGLFTLVVVMGGLLWAQITTGTISGTVKDSTGAVLPGATVEVQNVDTGISRTVSTDSRGYYTAPNLSVGQYAVTASLSGFQTAVRRGITLTVGQNAVIGFTLAVGAVTERVEVTGEAPLVETTTATVSGLVDEKQVQDLPLNARSHQDKSHPEMSGYSRRSDIRYRAHRCNSSVDADFPDGARVMLRIIYNGGVTSAAGNDESCRGSDQRVLA